MPSVNSSVLRRLFDYGARERRQVYEAITFTSLNKLFDIAPEILIGIAVDLVVRRRDSLLAQAGITDPMHQVALLGFATFVIWVCESIFEYLYMLRWKFVAQSIQHRLRQDTYRNMLRLDVGWFHSQRTGDIQAIINDDINQLERFLDQGLAQIIHISVSSVLIGGIFFWISPILAAGTILPIPIIMFGIWVFQRTLQPHYLKVRGRAGILSAKIESAILGLPIIKAFTAEEYQVQDLASASDDYQKANQAAIRVSSAFVPLIRTTVLTGFLITLVGGAWLVLNDQLQVGSYSVLIFLTQRFLWPFTKLGDVIDGFSRAQASTLRVFQLLETKAQVRSLGEEQDLRAIQDCIRFDNVRFGYEASRPVFANLDLTIPAGKMTAIVGPTGSGKSTLISLLMRFYDPTDGRITFGDKALEHFDLRFLRQQMSLVSQDAMLFPGSVIDNIAFGDTEPDWPMVQEAARLAEAAPFIERLPDGYHTAVGERGLKLSGGQRQRIAIARALYKQSSVVIFDEATSAVDNETEAAIQRSLARVAKECTTIVIAHRLSTIRRADLIYVLKEGKVAESGNHTELCGAGGFYSHLWRLQTGEM